MMQDDAHPVYRSVVAWRDPMAVVTAVVTAMVIEHLLGVTAPYIHSDAVRNLPRYINFAPCIP